MVWGVLEAMAWLSCISLAAPSMLKVTYKFGTTYEAIQMSFSRNFHTYSSRIRPSHILPGFGVNLSPNKKDLGLLSNWNPIEKEFALQNINNCPLFPNSYSTVSVVKRKEQWTCSCPNFSTRCWHQVWTSIYLSKKKKKKVNHIYLLISCLCTGFNYI